MNKQILFLTSALVFFIFSPSHASYDINFVSPQALQKIKHKFLKSKAPSVAIANKSWSCKMYGVRSLSEKNSMVVLYNLNFNPNGVIQNTGSQIVKTYAQTANELVGNKSVLVDKIRISSEEELISELSIKDPNSSTQSVVSYSVCRSV